MAPCFLRASTLSGAVQTSKACCDNGWFCLLDWIQDYISRCSMYGIFTYSWVVFGVKVGELFHTLSRRDLQFLLPGKQTVATWKSSQTERDHLPNLHFWFPCYFSVELILRQRSSRGFLSKSSLDIGTSTCSRKWLHLRTPLTPWQALLFFEETGNKREAVRW